MDMLEKTFWPYNTFLFTTILNGVLGHYLPYKVKICPYSVISGLAIALYGKILAL